MITFIVLLLAYLLGYAASFAMMRMEIAAEKATYTRGHQFLAVLYSFASWIMVLIILVKSWIERIRLTGYFDGPVKTDKPAKPVNQ